jgi:lipopolysaccharide transport protein LptA
MKKHSLLIGLYLIFLSPIYLIGQVNDLNGEIQIQNAHKFLFRTIDANTQLQVLSGNVKMKQGTMYLDADSVTYNEQTKLIEAFGNVHIQDGDSLNIYSDYLLYEGGNKIANFKNNVRLTDGSGTLTTKLLEYDMKTKLGNYKNGGTIVSKQTTLTSESGYFNGNKKEVRLVGKVKMTVAELTLTADSLLYNSQKRVANFIAPTNIKTGSSVIQVKKGTYDLNTKKAKFSGRTRIQDSTSFITANDFVFDETSGQGEAQGDVDFIDTAQNILLKCGKLFFNKKRKNVLAVGKPVMTLIDKTDSVFIAADTIYSAKYAELAHLNSDDTLKFITAYRNVRIYNDSLQAICDSLFYGEKDSLFKLYQQPVAWSRNSQILGDTILIETINRQPKAMHVIDNAMVVQEIDHHFKFYNQIKGKIINGYFKNGAIDLIESSGNSESIYYIKDENDAYIGMNRSEADEISIFFYESAIKKIKFNTAVKGTTYPVRQIPEDDKLFKSFKWLESKRPKNKHALFVD